MQKPSEFFQKLEAEQLALGFEVFTGDGNPCEEEGVEFQGTNMVWRRKLVGDIMQPNSYYRRSVPKPAPAPFVDLPIEWLARGPRVEVLDNHGTGLTMDARPGLLHVVDGHRYRLDIYVFADDETLTTPCDEGRLATAARFYLEVQP
jgi:hypothetical protein